MVAERIGESAGGDAEPMQVARRYGVTPRELQVLRLTMRGLATKQIARLLGTTGHTVHNQLFSLHQRAGVQSNVQLALWALRNGLVSLAETADETADETAPVDQTRDNEKGSEERNGHVE